MSCVQLLFSQRSDYWVPWLSSEARGVSLPRLLEFALGPADLPQRSMWGGRRPLRRAHSPVTSTACPFMAGGARSRALCRRREHDICMGEARTNGG